MAWYHPALFAIEPERAHALTLRALAAWGRFPGSAPASPERLRTTVGALSFANPLCIAAGLDKNGEAVGGLQRLGVAGVEIGTLTPLPQPGNPRPRIFRLREDAALINRLGFNNRGLEAGLARVARWPGQVGVNVGANKDAADRIANYRLGVARAAPLARWVTINISSPNTPGLRDLQARPLLDDLLAACIEARGKTPLWLKVAPDLSPPQVDDIARAAIEAGVDALIIGNTTVSRPPLRAAQASETGGLSGAPLAELARERLADFRAATGGALPLIAAGGVGSAEEAYARLRAGASLVQLYTALVYEGPGLIAGMLAGLDELLARDGFTSAAEAVG